MCLLGSSVQGCGVALVQLWSNAVCSSIPGSLPVQMDGVCISHADSTMVGDSVGESGNSLYSPKFS